MTNTPGKNSDAVRDVLYEFSMAKPRPDADLLEEFIRRFPEHAEALTEFAIRWTLDVASEAPESPEPPPLTRSPAVERAMSRFHNKLHEVRQATTANVQDASTADNPLATLDRAMARRLQDTLGVNRLLLIKLRDRSIRPDTIPDHFQRRLADAIGVPHQVIANHLRARPEIQAGARFLSERKPEVSEQETFEEAVRTSNLTEEQQKLLLNG